VRVIKADLPADIETLELHTFADEHIGDDCCDLARLKARIEYVASTPNAYCILNGDILDYASRSSIGDIETREFNIMGQLEKAVELFTPIAGKIICVTNGNHEARGYRKEGFDMSKMIAMQLGIADKYAPAAAAIFLRFGKQSLKREGRPQLYTIYVLHGSGGGRKEGAKAIRLADMASIMDADIYIHSHTHLPMVMKQGFFRTDLQHSTVANVTKLFVNTAANLNYGGYGEAAEFKPASTDTPVIYMRGSKKEMWAKL
jgi:predicted phosphodiesterase